MAKERSDRQRVPLKPVQHRLLPPHSFIRSTRMNLQKNERSMPASASDSPASRVSPPEERHGSPGAGGKIERMQTTAPGFAACRRAASSRAAYPGVVTSRMLEREKNP